VDGAGWEYVHVAIEDHSRIAFSAIFPDEKADSTAAFLLQALAYYARLGIRFRAILTDNGPADRSLAFAVACRTLGLKHRFTGLTRRAPTAKPNAPSRLRCASGPTRAPARTQTSAARSCAPGCASTTGTDLIVALDCRHPTADQGSIGTTCATP
jgi:hypothetical protein